MSDQAKKIVLSKTGYSQKHDALLHRLIDEKILLFCAVGKDCELWHDIMNELFLGYGEERDFFMLTSRHNDETLNEVVQFAEMIEIKGIGNEKIKIIEI